MWCKAHTTHSSINTIPKREVGMAASCCGVGFHQEQLGILLKLKKERMDGAKYRKTLQDCYGLLKNQSLGETSPFSRTMIPSTRPEQHRSGWTTQDEWFTVAKSESKFQSQSNRKSVALFENCGQWKNLKQVCQKEWAKITYSVCKVGTVGT